MNEEQRLFVVPHEINYNRKIMKRLLKFTYIQMLILYFSIANNLEEKLKLISDQNESSFSSLIDYLNLVYDLEAYLKL